MFRPKNVFCDVKNIFLVGGGTQFWERFTDNFESSNIRCRLVEERYGRSFDLERSDAREYKPVTA